MKTVLRSKAFWVCAFFLVVALVSKCVFDTSGLAFKYYISSDPPPDGCRNLAYSFTFTAAGGTTPYTWTFSGNIPTGLTGDSTSGILSGTPTRNGTYRFTVKVKDKAGASLAEDYVVSIQDFNIIDSYTSQQNTKSYTTLIYCPNVSFDHAIGTCGGTTPFTWSLKSGSLPSGMTLTTGGHISGKTSASGTYPVTVLVTDSAGLSAEHDYSLATPSSVQIGTASPLPKGQTSKAYTPYQLEACGGTPPYTWDEPNGDIPKGLTLSSTGLIQGTPTKFGDTTFLVTVTDKSSTPTTDQKYFSISIAASPLSITSTSPLANATECTSYTTTLKGSGGTGTYAWTVPATSKLPGGLTLTSLGVLSGTPTVPGSYSFVVNLSDGSSTVSGTFSLTVVENPTSTSELVVPEVRQVQGGVTVKNDISLKSANNVNVDFRFTTFGFPTNFAATAKLSVEGLCSYSVSAANFSNPTDFNADGYKEVAARFDPTDVATMLAAAGKAAGDKATLRLQVDVAETGKTYYQTIDVAVSK
jgi:hypothetical protein